jgi:hypothetical protein
MAVQFTARWAAVTALALALPAVSWAQRGGGMHGGGGMRGGRGMHGGPGFGGGGGFRPGGGMHGRPGFGGGFGHSPGFGFQNGFHNGFHGGFHNGFHNGFHGGFHSGFHQNRFLVHNNRFFNNRVFHNGFQQPFFASDWWPWTFNYSSFYFGVPYSGYYLADLPYPGSYPSAAALAYPDVSSYAAVPLVLGRERGYYPEPPTRDREAPEKETPERRAVEEPASLPDMLRRQLRVESAEPGVYLVRWTGSVEGLRTLEVRSVNAKDETVASRLLQDAPHRGLLRVPDDAAAAVVTLQAKDGTAINLRLPLAEFKALAEK